MAKIKKEASQLLPEEKQPYSIPENWVWVSVDAINNYKASSVDPMKSPDSTFELYSVPSSASDYPEIVQGADIGSTKQSVQKGDVLLCKINPRINRVWNVAKHTDNTLLASSEWIVVRNQRINPLYLMYYFQTKVFREYMLSNVSGVGGSLMRAQPKFVKDYPVPIAPLQEQNSIVRSIESLFAKLDEAKEKAQAVVDGYEQRKATILHQAYTGELTKLWRRKNNTSRDEWKAVQWGELIASIEAGKNWNAEGHPPCGDEFGVVKVSSVTWGEFNELESKTCTIESQWNEKTQIQVGDFLFSRANTLQLVGNCVIVKNVTKKVMLSDKILRFNFHDSVNPEYVLYFTRTDLYRKQIEALASGNQDGMRNVSQKNMKLVELPIAPLAEQHEVVTILENLLMKELQAKETAEAVIDQIDAMKKSILARAFRGELGTNDSSDASAEELVIQTL